MRIPIPDFSFRDRLAHFLYETAQRMPVSYDEADIGFWEVIADALLASEEFAAGEEELARLRSLLPDRRWIEMLLAQPTGDWCGDEVQRRWAQAVLAEHARLDAGKEEGR